MKYSIIVGYRNKEINRVKLFLDSLKNQTNSDFELVFVNYFSDTNFQSDIKAILKNYNLNLNLIDLPPSGKKFNRFASIRKNLEPRKLFEYWGRSIKK